MMSENTKNQILDQPRTPWWVWCLLLLLAIGAFTAGLDMPLVGPDEPRYSQVAREMFERGDLVTPTLGGYHWFEKPALLYWLQIAAYGLMGVNEFAARTGSALFGIGTAASLWILGSLIDKAFGRWIAVMAASTLGIVVFAHGASFDIIVTFPLTAAMVSYYVFDHTSSDRKSSSIIPLAFFYFFIGLALLAKGLIGIVFPFAIVTFYHLLSWKLPRRQFLISLAWGPVLAFVAAGLWYWPMYTRHGYEFIDEFILQHHFQRFTSNKYQHPQPFYFFLWVLPLMTIPWLPFFAAAVIKRVRSFFASPRNERQIEAFSQLETFAWAWMLVPLVFFSLSGSKLPGYILPSVPPAIVITAIFVKGLIEKSDKWRHLVLTLAGLTLAVLICVAIFAAPRFAEPESVSSLFTAADERGFTTQPVLLFLRISHNAEYYAAGRLTRDAKGRQHRITSKAELLEEIRSHSRDVLVLVPNENLSELTESDVMASDVIASNGKLTIVRASLK
jgi:4-amino-4-deoxy-L-arabinose transferase-like glycosyltransferase